MLRLDMLSLATTLLHDGIVADIAFSVDLEGEGASRRALRVNCQVSKVALCFTTELRPLTCFFLPISSGYCAIWHSGYAPPSAKSS